MTGRMIVKVFIMGIMMVILGPVSSSSSSSSCVKEFSQCVMPRDCCDGLQCIGGDWAQTTDSTCLSIRSQNIASLSLSSKEQRILLETYYTERNVSKTSEELDDILKRFRPFARLVQRLEQKYQQPFVIPQEKNDDGGDKNKHSKENEL